ncbi:MliC family protein [Sedimentitalea sp. XS_ASV28]|uniref:MliC family protein n=1 Tax=Sedimentitalea sp. XS_ASV28 TaxID=3241296 RepID=UPI00351155C3
MAVMAMTCAPLETVAQDGPDISSRVFQCERGVLLPVTFITPLEGAGSAVMQIEGKQVAMRALPTASGVCYVSLDEQDSYRLHIKGDEGFVTHMAADHTAEEEPVLRDCAIIRP